MQGNTLAFSQLIYYNTSILQKIAGDNMKIKDDFILRKVADTYVVVPVNSMTLDFNGIINLNETGAFLFEILQKGATKEELLEKMLEEYEVSEKKASDDIDVFVQKIKDADILE